MQKFPEDTTEPEELREPFRPEKETDANLSGSYGGKSAEYTETVMFEGPNSISDYDLVIPVSQVSGTIKLADFEDIPEVRYEEEEEPEEDFYRENSAASEPEEDILNTDPAAVQLETEVYFPEEKTPEAKDSRPVKDNRPVKDTRPAKDSRPRKDAPSAAVTSVPRQETAKPAGKQDKSKKARPKKSIAGKAAAGIVILLAAGLGAGYYHYYRYFQTHFYSGTTINGTDVSYETADVVKSRFNDLLQDYTLTISGRGGAEEVLTAEQLGWSYHDDGKIDELLSRQDAAGWLLHTKDRHDYEISVGSTYDEDKAAAAIGRLNALSASRTDSPEDAYIRLTEDGFYEIVPESEGNEVDRDRLDRAVAAALSEGKKNLDLTDPDCYYHPDIYSDDPVLTRRRDAWNYYMGTNLVYHFGSNTETIDGEVIRNCLTDDGSDVTISTDWITPMVSSWAEKYNTLDKERQFTTHSGETVAVEPGDYGWSLDVDATAEVVTTDVLAGNSGDREAVWTSRAMGWDNGDLTGTFIEISLEEQKLWFYRDGVLTAEADIVSGSGGTKDTPTGKGVYSVDTKELLSEDTEKNSSRWRITFNGSQGLTDAPWRKLFGRRIYRSNGTDGSIEIPSDIMQILYDAVETGTAVVIY